MKTFVLALALLISFTASAQFTSANLTAAGLTCAMCTRAINIALEKLPFVEKVTPNIKSSSFDISFKSSSTVSFDQMKAAVEDAGFSVAKLKVKADFNNVAVQNDTHIKLGGNTLHFLKTPASTLNGERAITLVDKNFVTDKEHKKYAAATKMACVNTGKAASCCHSENIAEGTRIYHVTI